MTHLQAFEMPLLYEPTQIRDLHRYFIDVTNLANQHGYSKPNHIYFTSDLYIRACHDASVSKITNITNDKLAHFVQMLVPNLLNLEPTFHFPMSLNIPLSNQPDSPSINIFVHYVDSAHPIMIDLKYQLVGESNDKQ